MAYADKYMSWAARDNYRRYCKKKISEKAAKNRKIADAIKVEIGCVDCGYNANAKALQFDHRDGSTKKGLVSQMVKQSTPAMLAEIQKCDVRCANCHIIRTYETGQHLAENRPRKTKHTENPHPTLIALK
jgi:hypothetical protein